MLPLFQTSKKFMTQFPARLLIAAFVLCAVAGAAGQSISKTISVLSRDPFK